MLKISLKDCKKFSAQTEVIKREIHFCLTLRSSGMSLVTFWALTLKKNAFHAGVVLVIWMKKYMMMKTWQVSLYPQKPSGQTAGSYSICFQSLQDF